MIPVVRPTIRRTDMGAVLSRLAVDSIGVGDVSKELAGAVAKYLDRRGGVAVRSWYRGLVVALRALALDPGTGVGLSALAPRSAAAAVLEAGLVPVLLDVQRSIPILPSPLDVDYVAYGLGAIIVDTRYGYVPDIENFMELGIPVIEDVSEGFGGNTGHSKVGHVGDIAIVGLEPEHIVTAGGGALVLASASRKLATLHGLVDADAGEPALPDMNAALGLAQLRQIEQFVERRRDIAARFSRALARSPHHCPPQGGDAEHVFASFPVVVESSPRDVEAYARSKGVTAVRAFAPSALDDVSDVAASGEARFTSALSLASRVLAFPLYPTLQASEQETIERVLGTLP